MFNIFVDYPTETQEREIVGSTTGATLPEVDRVLAAADIVRLQKVVRSVPVSEHIVSYAVRLSRATRPGGEGPAFVRDWVAWGAGPRASQYLVLGGKARAILHGRETPAAEDIRAVAPAVLRHRIVTNFNAEADGIKPDDIIAKLLDEVREPDKA